MSKSNRDTIKQLLDSVGKNLEGAGIKLMQVQINYEEWSLEYNADYSDIIAKTAAYIDGVKTIITAVEQLRREI